jgi:RHS repeat-associated protein
VKALLTQQKQTRRSRLPLSQLIPGWVQVALFGWMICWDNHPPSAQSSYDPGVEYVAVNQTPWGWSEIEFANGKARQGEMNGSERIKTARIDYSKSSPEQSDGRAERERASQTDFATAGYYFVYGSDGRLYGRYTPVKNQNLSRDYVGRVNGSSQSMSGTSLLNETIAWNPDGTQSGNSITRNGATNNSDGRSYGYDLRSRLTSSSFGYPMANTAVAAYQFDGGAAGGLGLRTGINLSGLTGNNAASFGTFARLGSMSVSGSLTNNSVGTPVSQTYDAAGNATTRTAGGSTDTLTWDAFGQLVRDVRTGTGAFTWSAVYDGLGRRLQTTEGALTVQSSYDPEVEFLELVTTINGVRNWHVTGPDLDGRYGGLNGCGGVEAIYNQSTSSATYLLSDTYGHSEGTLSGTTFVWNPTQCDGYGALPGTTKPSALVAGANVASQLGWRGHYIDPTGFYYMGARNYAPDSGTFLSPDPLGHSASMDLYSYCNGDPLNQYDADGRVATGFNSGLNGNISANAPTSSAFYVGNLVGGYLSGAGTGIQNGAGGTVNALSLGNVKGAFGSDPSSFEYHSGQVGGAMLGGVAAIGTGGLAYNAVGGTAGLSTLYASASANALYYGGLAAPVAYNLGNAITGENAAGSLGKQLSLPAPSVAPNAGGVIRSFVQETDQIYYRVFSGNQQGAFLTAVPPGSSAFAKNMLALPPQNTADLIQEVLVPAGTRLQRSRALPNFGFKGGGEQFQLLDSIPNNNFRSGVPLK